MVGTTKRNAINAPMQATIVIFIFLLRDDFFRNKYIADATNAKKVMYTLDDFVNNVPAVTIIVKVKFVKKDNVLPLDLKVLSSKKGKAKVLINTQFTDGSLKKEYNLNPSYRALSMSDESTKISRKSILS